MIAIINMEPQAACMPSHSHPIGIEMSFAIFAFWDFMVLVWYIRVGICENLPATIDFTGGGNVQSLQSSADLARSRKVSLVASSMFLRWSVLVMPSLIP